MDEKEGFLLIGTTTVILVIFLIAVLMVMLIYRKRGIEHLKELELMNERFARELLQTELEIQKQTMQELGREIHDNVGQKLTLAVLYAHQLAFEAEPDGITRRVQAITGIISESLQDLRALSKSLTSDYILQTDLVAILRNECEKTRSLSGCALQFHTNIAELKAPYTIKNVVVRFVQECIQNSLKHARCSAINIEVNHTGEGLSITAADNGIGFQEDGPADKGIGLANMKKRAAIIGATLAINGKTGQGTAMQLFIPHHLIG